MLKFNPYSNPMQIQTGPMTKQPENRPVKIYSYRVKIPSNGHPKSLRPHQQKWNMFRLLMQQKKKKIIIIWLKKLLENLNLPQKLPIILYENNQSGIKMIQSEKCNCKRKYIDTKFHIKHLRKTGISWTWSIAPNKLMTADILTKPVLKLTLKTDYI